MKMIQMKCRGRLAAIEKRLNKYALVPTGRAEIGALGQTDYVFWVHATPAVERKLADWHGAQDQFDKAQLVSFALELEEKPCMK